MIEEYIDGSYEELQNCTLNMVPTRRQLLLVFQATQETWADFDVDQSNKHYYEVSRLTQADGNH
eukprot:7364895-Ditylum_brightwellii.AAC.1